MFGYVRPLKGELLVREYEEYKAVYCTLCNEIGKNYGRRMRMALSYDLTFYTMLALDLEDAKPKLKKGRCVVNPTKKCNFICEGDLAYKKGAALTVLITYHKIMDNIADEGFFSRLGAKLLLPFVKGPAKKAKADFPFMAKAIEQMMAEQQSVENEDKPSVDACCEPTAKALAAIFGELGEIKGQQGFILSQLGYFLGRWVYSMDAADDLKDDLKDQAFNPLIDKLKLRGVKEIPEADQSRIDNECNEMLNNNVAMINSAMNLLELNRYSNIIN